MTYFYLLACMAFLDLFTFKEENREEEEEQQNLPSFSTVHKGRVEEEELNLPLGYRFSPTARELIVHYLTNKILGCRLPANVIADIDLYAFNPDQLPIGEFKYGKKNEAYFFTHREQKYPKATQPRQTTDTGYWKTTGGDVQIFCGDAVIGFQKILVFYWGKAPRGRRSSWILHEYRINPESIPVDQLNDGIISEMERCVICRIHHKEYKEYSGSVKRSRSDSRMELAADSTSSDGEENQIDFTYRRKVPTLNWDGSADSCPKIRP